MRWRDLFKRVPTTWRQQRRTVVGGILLILAGGLLILSGTIYNQLSGFSYDTRLVEGEVTVLPYVPFVVKLEQFTLAYHSPQAFDNAEPGAMPERQEIALTLLQNDQILGKKSTQAGRPVHAAGISLLPSDTDTGWAFSLVVRDPGGREKVIPVNPWDPPLTRLGLTRQHVFAESVARIGASQDNDTTTARPNAAEIFLVEANGDRQSLGFASKTTPVSASGYMVSVWGIRPYTGLRVYHRPGLPILIIGIVCLLAGLSITGINFGASARRRSGGD